MEGVDAYIYIAMMKAASEIEASVKHNLRRDEKYSIGLFAKNNDKLLNRFKKQGLFDDPFFDKTVEVFVEAYCSLQENISSCISGPSEQSS